MKKELQDQVILITGSSQGIGKALAMNVGLAGARVGLNGRNKDKLTKTYEELSGKGIDCLMVPGDVTDYKVCEGIVKTIIDKYGRLDCLVANASMMIEGGIEENQPDAIEKGIDGLTLGTYYPIKASIDALKESKGYILLISSLMAIHGLPRYSIYAMGKFAQTGLSQSLSFELGKYDIKVGICYVCFVQNDPDKQMILPSGEVGKLTERPGKMQYSREKVAGIIAGMIRRRNRRLVMSYYGKFYDYLARLVPAVIRAVMKRNLPE